MVIMRFLAGIFVYLLFFLTVLCLVLFGIFLITPGSTDHIGIQHNRTASIVIGALCIAFGVLLLIAFCCFRKKIKLASVVVKVSAQFVAQNCGLLFLPLLLFVFMVIFIILWILEALGYYSLGTPIHEKHQLPFQHFETSGGIKALGLFHVFQLLWVLLFLVATNDFIVCGAACSWYFQRE